MALGASEYLRVNTVLDSYGTAKISGIAAAAGMIIKVSSITNYSNIAFMLNVIEKDTVTGATEAFIYSHNPSGSGNEASLYTVPSNKIAYLTLFICNTNTGSADYTVGIENTTVVTYTPPPS